MPFKAHDKEIEIWMLLYRKTASCIFNKKKSQIIFQTKISTRILKFTNYSITNYSSSLLHFFIRVKNLFTCSNVIKKFSSKRSLLKNIKSFSR